MRMLEVLYYLYTLNQITKTQLQNGIKIINAIKQVNKEKAINDIAICNPSLSNILYSNSYQNLVKNYLNNMLFSIVYAESTYTNLKENYVGDVGFFQINKYIWNPYAVRKNLCYNISSVYAYYDPNIEANVASRILLYNIAEYISKYGYGHPIYKYAITYHNMNAYAPNAYIRNIQEVLFKSIEFEKNSNTININNYSFIFNNYSSLNNQFLSQLNVINNACYIYG